MQPRSSAGLESRLLRPADHSNASLDSYQMSAYALGTKSAAVSQVENTTSGEV